MEGRSGLKEGFVWRRWAVSKLQRGSLTFVACAARATRRTRSGRQLTCDMIDDGEAEKADPTSTVKQHRSTVTRPKDRCARTMGDNSKTGGNIGDGRSGSAITLGGRPYWLRFRHATGVILVHSRRKHTVHHMACCRVALPDASHSLIAISDLVRCFANCLRRHTSPMLALPGYEIPCPGCNVFYGRPSTLSQETPLQPIPQCMS